MGNKTSDTITRDADLVGVALARAMALSEQSYVLIRSGMSQGKRYYRVNLRARGRDYRGMSQTSVQEALERACENVVAAESKLEPTKAIPGE